MVRLRRTVRVNINPSGAGDPPTPTEPDACPNGFAGKPSSRGLARYYEFDVTCRGEPDAQTGYLVNIHVIDRAVRRTIVPALEAACVERPEIEPAVLLSECVPGLATALRGSLDSVRWRVNPYYHVSMAAADATNSPPRVYLRQRFDFAAAHRLNVAEMSEDENRSLFGKCNNPSGHGHNYQFEPCVAVTLAEGSMPFSLPHLERLADEAIVSRFDHAHLNVDTEEFSEDGGLNPSVENIARVFFERLAPRVSAASPHAELVSMTVWETDRTSCTFPDAPPA